MTAIALPGTGGIDSAFDGSRAFLVTRQDHGSRRYERLGVLSQAGEGWIFRYFSDVAADPEIPLLPGLPSNGAAVRSRYLFPLFAQRVLSPRRPDRSIILASLGLDETATSFEILARNGGRRQGDTIELIQMPVSRGDGTESLEFLVHGMRYRSDIEQRMVDSLSAGDGLHLLPETENPTDPEAHLVATASGTVLGWVPAPLVPLISRATDAHATVAHVNGSTSNPHLRLLVELRGSLIDASHFDDSRWDLAG